MIWFTATSARVGASVQTAALLIRTVFDPASFPSASSTRSTAQASSATTTARSVEERLVADGVLVARPVAHAAAVASQEGAVIRDRAGDEPGDHQRAERQRQSRKGAAHGSQTGGELVSA